MPCLFKVCPELVNTFVRVWLALYLTCLGDSLVEDKKV